MKYHLSAHSLHLTAEVSQHLDNKLAKLAKILPTQAQQQTIELHLHHNTTYKLVEGSAELRLPGKTLTAHHQGRSVTMVLDKLLSKLKTQITTYKATHDRRHSDYPSQQTIRKSPGSPEAVD